MSRSLEFKEVPLDGVAKIAADILYFGAGYQIWILEGQMGSGKTTFVKDLCKQLGVSSEVHSPSFGIVNEYETHEGMIIYHFDCYRMRSEEEAYDIGMEEYLDSGNMCLIEWAEKIPSLIPKKFLKIEITLHNHTNRHFFVTQNG